MEFPTLTNPMVKLQDLGFIIHVFSWKIMNDNVMGFEFGNLWYFKEYCKRKITFIDVK